MVLYRAPSIPVGQRSPPPAPPAGTQRQHNRSIHRSHATERLPCMTDFCDTHTQTGLVNCIPNFCRRVQWGSSLSSLRHWEGVTSPISKTFRLPVFMIRAACKTVSWGRACNQYTSKANRSTTAKQAVPHQDAPHTHNQTPYKYIHISWDILWLFPQITTVFININTFPTLCCKTAGDAVASEPNMLKPLCLETVWTCSNLTERRGSYPGIHSRLSEMTRGLWRQLKYDIQKP